MFTQVLDEVVPISDLRRMRQCSLHCIRVSTGAIPADHVNFLVLLQPGEDGFSGAIGHEIERLAGLKIDQNGSIPVPTPHGEIIKPQHPHRRIRGSRNGTRDALNRVGALTFIPSRGARRSLTEASAASPMALSSSRRRLLTLAQGWTRSGSREGSDFSRAGRCPASKLAHTQSEHDSATSTGNVANRSLVLTMDMV